MALVESYISERGNIINIYDDYVVKTKEEVDQILETIGRIAGEALTLQEMKKYNASLVEEK